MKIIICVGGVIYVTDAETASAKTTSLLFILIA